MPRATYEDSCRLLQEQNIIDDGPLPPLPSATPRHDDDVLGVSFFRTMLGDAALDGLTLPRTYFGRSEIRASSFRDTDLSDSRANWNDIIDVDFTAADLSRCDLRGNTLERVCFRDARLVEVDLRCCAIIDCDFAGAGMRGAKITRQAGLGLILSSEQANAIDWQAEDGEEPEGG